MCGFGLGILSYRVGGEAPLRSPMLRSTFGFMNEEVLGGFMNEEVLKGFMNEEVLGGFMNEEVLGGFLKGRGHRSAKQSVGSLNKMI